MADNQIQRFLLIYLVLLELAITTPNLSHKPQSYLLEGWAVHVTEVFASKA